MSSGKVSSYTGKAWAVDSTNSKLKVQFFWPFSGDYWIVALDENYQWSVVSAPGRDYLWILVCLKNIFFLFKIIKYTTPFFFFN